MRILHTSDWHLGRVLFNVSLLEDQAYVLEQFIELAAELRPDLVIVAGDVYDRAVPPHDAVELLDETVARLAGELSLPTLIIAGNHDSPERLGFGARLLASSKLHVAGRLRQVTPLTLEDQHGPVDIVALPYASPETTRSELSSLLAQVDDFALSAEAVAAIRGHESALRAQLQVACSGREEPGRRKVAVAHAFVAGGEVSESERDLAVGGTGAVSSTLFDTFHYVALGHLHRPQRVGRDALRYSGSLLPYSFSEVDHERGPVTPKSVSLVELDAQGEVRIETQQLRPRRQMRVVRGELDALLQQPKGPDGWEDYLLVRLDDRQPRLDVMAKLRELYPNVLHHERGAPKAGAVGEVERVDHREMSPDALFAAFFREVTGEELGQEQLALVREAVDKADASPGEEP